MSFNMCEARKVRIRMMIRESLRSGPKTARQLSYDLTEINGGKTVMQVRGIIYSDKCLSGEVSWRPGKDWAGRRCLVYYLSPNPDVLVPEHGRARVRPDVQTSP